MRVRYVCDSCRDVIYEVEDPSITEEKIGLDLLTPEERQYFVENQTDAVVLSILCDECSALLSGTDWPEKPSLLH
ncbi:MAG: anti-sigma-F factor Fin family protein [Firmicutes bacterium]|nr:anti-sigma-F factor Fin family protein [Bacillota bacterium]